jgi:hypothetical protein
MSAALWKLFPALAALMDVARRHPEEFDEELLAQETREQRWVPKSDPPTFEQRRRMIDFIDPVACEALDRARTLARHWEDQEGVNASVIDAVRDAVFAWEGREATGETDAGGSA